MVNFAMPACILTVLYSIRTRARLGVEQSRFGDGLQVGPV
jgi:hypothetical protein